MGKLTTVLARLVGLVLRLHRRQSDSVILQNKNRCKSYLCILRRSLALPANSMRFAERGFGMHHWIVAEILSI